MNKFNFAVIYGTLALAAVVLCGVVAKAEPAETEHVDRLLNEWSTEDMANNRFMSTPFNPAYQSLVYIRFGTFYKAVVVGDTFSPHYTFPSELDPDAPVEDGQVFARLLLGAPVALTLSAPAPMDGRKHTHMLTRGTSLLLNDVKAGRRITLTRGIEARP